MSMTYFIVYGLLAVFSFRTALAHTFNQACHIIKYAILRNTANPYVIDEDIFKQTATWWGLTVIFTVLFFKFGW